MTSEQRERLEELTLRMLDGELDDGEIVELDALLEDEDAARLHGLLLEQEATLRGDRADLDVVDRTVTEIAASKRVEQRVLAAIKASGATWWQRSYTLAAAAALILVATLGGGAWWVNGWTAPPQEALIFGSSTFEPGAKAHVLVLVRNARTMAPYAQAAVTLTLSATDGTEVWETVAKTDERGTVSFVNELPADMVEGDGYTLRAVAHAEGYAPDVSRPVAVRRLYRIYVTTDKPRYQPGQTMHLRALAMTSSGLTPAADRDLTFSVRDAKGNLVSKKVLETSKHGLASMDFELADQVNMGRYTVSAAIGSTASERQALVDRYVLPKIQLEIDTAQKHYAPGAKVEGTVTAKYVFGEPVGDAKVEVTLLDARSDVTMANVVATEAGVGRWSFSASIPARFGDLEPSSLGIAAKVTDGAGFSNDKRIERTVTRDPYIVDLAIPGGATVYGVPNDVYLSIRTPDGKPAKVRGLFDGKRFATDESGLAAITVVPEGKSTMLLDMPGMRRVMTVNSAAGIILHSDKVIYEGGAIIELTVHASSPDGMAFVDAVQGTRTLWTKAVPLSAGGSEVAFDVPADVHGPIRLRAFHVNVWGNLKRSDRVVMVRARKALSLSATLDRDVYRPGETAKLKILVEKDGAPTAAAVSLAGVDESVFALSEVRPGMEQAYFELNRELNAPKVSLYPLDRVMSLEGPRRDRAARAALASLEPPDDAISAQGGDTYQARVVQTAADRERWLSAIGAIVLAVPLLACLALLFVVMARLGRAARAQVEREEQMAGAMRNVVLAWTGALFVPALTAFVGGIIGRENGAMFGAAMGAAGAVLLLRIAVMRVHALTDELSLDILLYAMGAGVLGSIGFGVAVEERLVKGGWFVIAVAVTYLAWTIVGGLLAAAGRNLATGATMRRVVWLVASRSAVAVVPLLGLGLFMTMATMKAEMEPQVTAAATPDAPPGAPPTVDMRLPDDGDQGQGPAPRVRSYFPETLLWKPELITDAQGRVELEVPLADSITTWRLSMSAVTTAGELGAAEQGLRVFQPFFVEPNLPVALTQNDVITVPVAVFNYLDAEQEVTVKLADAEWLTVDGSTTQSVRLAPREVKRVSFVVTAKRAGEHRFSVQASAGDVADAVERVVTVKPDGERIEAVASGELKESATLAVDIPDEAIAGSEDLLLKLYPGTFSQVAEGMEGVFKMPYGCFEQTSSVTYPSLLVMDYMQSTGKMRPELRAKAERFIQIGYQRLLSFEVPGGGFEWFGKTPAHPVLTAYGLMEFSDMSRVQAVDPDVIARTQQWLISQQKSDGTWSMASAGIAEGATNAYEGQDLRTTAYIAWALAESGATKALLTKTLDELAKGLHGAKDSYTVALIANALTAGQHPSAAVARNRLASMAKSDGGMAYWESDAMGVTYSSGMSLHVETTALAAHALLRGKTEVAMAHRAMAWLVKQRDPNGTWHSTQATVAAMRALLAAAGSTTIDEPLDVTVLADGEAVKTIHITPETADVFHLVSLRAPVRKGTRKIELRSTGGGAVAYQLVTSHYRPWKDRAAKRELALELSYDAKVVRVGGALQGRLKLTNNRRTAIDMAMVDIYVVPGFALDTTGLDALVADGIIERYDRRGAQVSLYVRDIAAGESLELSYRMVAEVAANVQAPPASAYLYYEPNVNDVTRPVSIKVGLLKD